ncbi:uracil-DNA glycosylase [Duganella sp. BJB488]|uniref:uracil-DNA glycosylase n=1 Tax=unclassified Duganella TaxID=2636909 RepID=UPI000E341E2F|nr:MULTISPECIES: uracil-DNA glycosylase [unclassified Duganella]NVD71306.1 uracil-DNA glycosylase [Duganella sp. BJB1802]RFP20464.1 uracil-DNA glycosylase [Duganella sp. BJB489]RFP21097.1 uracil-DNA glycosylase [Duganella sp. BJB488]RFP33636.1 uracil-DNA glycosylase [Duganella sp. BJB480]
MTIPTLILDALARADASWRPLLIEGLEAMMAATPDYLPQLAQDQYLPTEQRLFAAFALPLPQVRYVLVGEGPYPRAESATGVCFMDGAVGSLWSEEVGGGLSKQVNKATSLRNFMKMLLVADGQLSLSNTAGEAMAAVATRARSGDGAMIQTLAVLQDKLTAHGFLLLNASLVFRGHVAPAKDAKAWQPFFETVMAGLGAEPDPPPTLVLWGKIAEQLNKLPIIKQFPKIAAEHPYNLSFIANKDMHALFGPMQLLRSEL